MKLTRITKTMLLVSQLAKENNEYLRNMIALDLLQLLKDEETENYLKSYYLGL